MFLALLLAGAFRNAPENPCCCEAFKGPNGGRLHLGKMFSAHGHQRNVD